MQDKCTNANLNQMPFPPTRRFAASRERDLETINTRDGVAIILSEKMRKHKGQAGRSPAFDMCSQRITAVDLGTGVKISLVCIYAPTNEIVTKKDPASGEPPLVVNERRSKEREAFWKAVVYPVISTINKRTPRDLEPNAELLLVVTSMRV